MILGERRIGKTSLQTVAVAELTAQEPGRYVPLALPPALAMASLNDYAHEVLQSLCSRLGRNVGETGLVDSQGRFRFSSFGQFRSAVARLLEEAPKSRFILCIDEFDAILRNCPPPEANKILALTGDFIENRSLSAPIVFITMTRLLEGPLGDFSSPPIGKSEVIALQPFPRMELEEMVVGLLGRELTLSAAGMERLHRLSGGHPYFAKLLLDRLLARLAECKPQPVIGPDALEQVIPDAVNDPRAISALGNIYAAHFGQPERALLLLLANRQAAATATDLKLLGPGWIKAAKELSSRGYLAWDEAAGCDFRIEFLSAWLRNWEEFEIECAELGVEALRQKLDTDVVIDEGRGEVSLKGVPIKLSPQEYQTLVCLGRRVDQIVTRDALTEALWPDANGDVTNQAMDALIYRLRGKLGNEGPRYIETVPGQGFRLHRAALKTRPASP